MADDGQQRVEGQGEDTATDKPAESKSSPPTSSGDQPSAGGAEEPAPQDESTALRSTGPQTWNYKQNQNKRKKSRAQKGKTSEKDLWEWAKWSYNAQLQHLLGGIVDSIFGNSPDQATVLFHCSEFFNHVSKYNPPGGAVRTTSWSASGWTGWKEQQEEPRRRYEEERRRGVDEETEIISSTSPTRVRYKARRRRSGSPLKSPKKTRREAEYFAVNHQNHQRNEQYLAEFFGKVMEAKNSLRLSSQASLFERTAVNFIKRFLLDVATMNALNFLRINHFRQTITEFDESRIAMPATSTSSTSTSPYSEWTLPDGTVERDYTREINIFINHIRRRERQQDHHRY